MIINNKLGIHAIAGTDNPDRRLDVLFLHGLGGDAFSTWRHDNEYFWPEVLGADFPDSAVWTIAYGAVASQWIEDVMPMEDRAENLLNHMVLKGIGDRPFALITHSMGGLIAKYIITQAAQSNLPDYQKIAENCQGVVFLAVPHNGSGWSDLLGYAQVLVRGNKIVEQLSKDSSALRQLDKNFSQCCQRQKLVCHAFIETKEVRLNKKLFGIIPIPKGLKVVSESSASSSFLSKPPVPMDDDHLSICKLSDKEDQLYENIQLIIRDYLAQANQNVKPNHINAQIPRFQQAVLTGRLTKLHEQLARLQAQYDLETREEEKMRMEALIQQKQASLQQLETVTL